MDSSQDDPELDGSLQLAHGMCLRKIKLNFKPQKKLRKSNKEYQAEYLSRLRDDPEKWADHLRRQKMSHEKCKANMTEEQSSELRARRTAYMKSWRESKKQKILESAPPPNEPKPPKKKTRKQICDQREQWRESKRKYRASLSSAQVATVRLAEKQRRLRKKGELNPTEPISSPTIAQLVALLESGKSSTQPAIPTSTPPLNPASPQLSTTISELVARLSSGMNPPSTSPMNPAMASHISSAPLVHSGLVVDSAPQHTPNPPSSLCENSSLSVTDITNAPSRLCKNPSLSVTDTPNAPSSLCENPSSSAADTPNPFPHTDSTSSAIMSPSPTKNSKYSALKRTRRILPAARKNAFYVLKKLFMGASPKMKKELFSSMCEDLNVPTLPNAHPANPVPRKRTRNPTHAKEKVLKFYDEAAINVPCMKYFSKRLGVMRKVLPKPITVLYKEFKILHPDVVMSVRNFFRLRPAHILKLKSRLLQQCLCETCENARLQFLALKLPASHLSSVTDAINVTLCPYEGRWAALACVKRQCRTCGIHLLSDRLKKVCDLKALVTYDCWDAVSDPKCKGKKTTKLKRTCSVEALVGYFCNAIDTLALHRFTNLWQRGQFQNLKDNLPGACALIVLDFAENYTCCFQNQAQSSYYALSQVTIHPVVIYQHCHCGKVLTNYRVYVSDDTKHDACFVFSVLSNTLKSLDVSRFFIFSDNCCAQYKSRLPLFHITELSKQYEIERCFFGERHGKSECDSLGGLVKSF